MARHELDPALIAVPGADVDAVQSVVGDLGLIGWVVDGPVLGLGGWVVGVFAGDAERAWAVIDDEGTTIAWDVLRDRLTQQWPGALVGDDVTDRLGAAGPVPLSRAFAHTAVAVAPRSDLMLGVVAKSYDTLMHQAVRDDHVLVGMELGEQHGDDALDYAFGAVRRVVVTLWRRGPVTGVAVLRKGDVVGVHWWAPHWLPVGPADAEDLRETMLPPVGDAAVFGDVLDLDPSGVVNLRAMFRRPTPDLDGLAELLDLPAEAIDVLEGRATVAELPGGEVVGPSTIRAEMRKAMESSDDDPVWVQRFEHGARELRPWYVVWSLATIVLGVALIAWAGGVDGFRGWIGLFFVGGTVADLAVRSWLRRRRA